MELTPTDGNMGEKWLTGLERKEMAKKKDIKIPILILMDLNFYQESAQWFWHSSLDLTYGEPHYLCALLLTLARTLETQPMVFPRSMHTQKISPSLPS